jgi:hypothetical protein
LLLLLIFYNSQSIAGVQERRKEELQADFLAFVEVWVFLTWGSYGVLEEGIIARVR